MGGGGEEGGRKREGGGEDEWYKVQIPGSAQAIDNVSKSYHRYLLSQHRDNGHVGVG